jgi:predicted RNase H-like nuclease
MSCSLWPMLTLSGLAADSGKWQIECYPHPALIELFNLKKRHQYKKGRVVDKKRGQCQLAELLLNLTQSPVLRLTVPDGFSQPLRNDFIESLSGTTLKQNEDVLDAIVCLYARSICNRG